MITNLFSIFDPSTSFNFSNNWISIFLFIILTPLMFWVQPNRITKTIQKLIQYIFSEFRPLIKKAPQTIIIILTLFIFILINNLPRLIPYIYTATAHISITLIIALPLWLALILHGWIFNTSNLLVHLIPNGTPTILIPFIVLIETIRNIIRPLTLAIRLAANIIAGHLLITLLTSATPICPLLALPVLGSAQLALASLEIAVAIIQAYVFRVLITLYVSERIS